jgi:cell wall-associated NlpC family hydrolase
MKKFIAFAALLVILAGCSASQAAAAIPVETPSTNTQARVEEPNLIEISIANVREEKMSGVITKLKNRIGKTRYVFSGVTPYGWDCSGLVVWAYEQLGVELPHSANKQGHLGTKVSAPKIGDIVVFGYPKSESYYHASIYVGNNKVIHAGFKSGTTTSIISLDDPSFNGSTVTFIQVNW